MVRTVLSDAQWAKMAPHCKGKRSDQGRPGENNRRFVEAVLWIVRTGAPSRGLPRARHLEERLQALPGVGEGGRLQASVRCRIGRAGHGIRHDRRHDRPCPSSRPRCKRGTCRQAIGKSKGGWTTKIVALTDALGILVRFELLPAHRYDTVGVPPLIDGLAFDALIADKAYDSNWLVEDLDDRGAKVVISKRPNAWRPALSTRPCMDGAISSRTSSAISRTSNASRSVQTRPTTATKQ